MDLRILWHSCAPFVYSGYGIVTKNVALPLGQIYSLAISSYYGLHPGASINIAGVKVMPTIEQDYGSFSVKHYIEKFKINLPILASDFWPFKWFAELPSSMLYGPIDSFDYSSEDIQVMKTYSYFIPCSEFGGRVYRKLTKTEPTAIIPHGVNVQVYQPSPKIPSRQMFNIPTNKFVWGIVAANSDPEPRKGWDDMFVAFSDFLKKFPNERKKWVIFAYTKPTDQRGYNLPELAKKLGLSKNILFPEHLPQMVGLPDPEMAKLYSSFNVLVNASRREGFCIPVIEAQACGVPIVASNSSSLPELVKGHGWLVKMGEKVFAPKGWECFKVSREDLLKKMEDAYFNSELRKQYAEQSLQFAQAYDWSKIVSEQWIPLLEKLKSTSFK